MLNKISDKAMIVMILAGCLIVVCIQLGLYHGRKLEREAVREELRMTNDELQIAKNKLKEMEKELEHQKLIRAIANCESSMRHDGIWGDGGMSYGVFQFKKPSFVFLAKKMGFKNATWTNKEHQIIVASWAFKNGYERWWSCYKRVLNK